jgi:hypothetical protein
MLATAAARGRRDDRVHAGDPACCRRRIDVADAAVRDPAAKDSSVQHSVALQVVDELFRSGKEARIFGAIDRLSDQRSRREVH